MEGEVASVGKNDEESYRDKLSKTYDNIVSRKAAQLARDAQFDRRAQMLTKHFMQAHEQKEKQKIDSMHEASQRNYGKSMQRVHDGYASENMLKEMVREEKNQISQLMNMRTQQREIEEEKEKEKQDRRNFYRDARRIHDRLQNEERQKLLDDKAQQRRDAIAEKLKDHDARAKELLDQKSLDQASNTEKFENHLAKVHEAKKLNDYSRRKEQSKRWAEFVEKGKSADDARRKAAELKQQSLRDQEEARQRKVQERQQAQEQELLEKCRRIFNKGSGSRSPETSKHESHSPRPEGPSVHADGRKRNQEENKDLQGGDCVRRDRSPRDKSSLPTCWNRELIQCNTQVQKEYVAHCGELDDARYRMRTNKKYKALAEGAEGSEEDYRVARLRAVHQAFVATKPKEPKKDVPISTRGSQRPVARPARTLMCGFCEREYPPDHLVGSALRRTVERLRQTPHSRQPSSARERYGTHRQAESAEDDFDAPKGSPGHSASRGRSGGKTPLYDYEVKLCVNCDIFVRISSA